MARILVIEDTPTVSRVLARLLERAGHQVVVRPTADEALDVVRAESVDLVLTDIFLPGKNGLALIRELGERYPRVPVIAITGGDARWDADVLGAATEAGAVAALRKPFGSDVLLGAVARALGERTDDPQPGTEGG